MLTILWFLSNLLPSCLTCIEASPKQKVEPLSPQHRWESSAVTSITPLNSAMLTPVCLPGLHVDHFWSWTQLINHFSNQCTSYSAFYYTHTTIPYWNLVEDRFGSQFHQTVLTPNLLAAQMQPSIISRSVQVSYRFRYHPQTCSQS